MAPKQQQQQSSGGEIFTTDIIGMSKRQLYDIMSQMKVMIEQNPEQARQILIDNPRMTRAVFQEISGMPTSLSKEQIPPAASPDSAGEPSSSGAMKVDKSESS